MIEHRTTRRGFIGATGGLTIGLGACSTLKIPNVTSAMAIGQPMPEGVVLPQTPSAKPAPDSVGYAVIGLGDYALKQIMPRISQARRSHISALVSGNPRKLAEVGDAYGVPTGARYSYDEFSRLAQNDEAEAVYIALPTGLHAEWAERAFAIKKHVLTEKPMALSSAECDRMIAAADRANRKLMVAYRCHFEPHNLRAMEIMREGTLGELRLIRTEHAYRMGPTTPTKNWRANRTLAGGGPLEDYGIYGLQAALYLSGEMPTEVSAATLQPPGDPRFSQIFAQVSSQLRFSSGAVAQLSTSYDRIGRNCVEVRGTEGALMMEPATGYAGHDYTLVTGQTRQTLSPGSPEVQFTAQFDHFADAVRDGTAIRTPGEMGRRDLRLIEAIYRAAAQNRTIQLNADGTMRG